MCRGVPCRWFCCAPARCGRADPGSQYSRWERGRLEEDWSGDLVVVDWQQGGAFTAIAGCPGYGEPVVLLLGFERHPGTVAFGAGEAVRKNFHDGGSITPSDYFLPTNF